MSHNLQVTSFKHRQLEPLIPSSLEETEERFSKNRFYVKFSTYYAKTQTLLQSQLSHSLLNLWLSLPTVSCPLLKLSICDSLETDAAAPLLLSAGDSVAAGFRSNRTESAWHLINSFVVEAHFENSFVKRLQRFQRFSIFQRESPKIVDQTVSSTQLRRFLKSPLFC